MKLFTAKIVDMMKHEKLYASQGGPIVLFQISWADNQIHLLKMPSTEILKSIAGIKVQICERNHQPAIALHPTRLMAVSSSYGGDFKVWIRNHEIKRKDRMLQKTGWTCHAVGSYKKKPLTAATFSPDGSVLAVAAETVITLWDPEKNVLVAVIGESLEPIKSLSFLGKSEHLVSSSQGSNPQVSVREV